MWHFCLILCIQPQNGYATYTRKEPMHTSFSAHVARIALTCGLLYSGVPYAISYAQNSATPPHTGLSVTSIQANNAQNQSTKKNGLGDHPTQLSQEPKDNLEKTSEDDDQVVYQRKKDLDIKNPFPDVISDEEIATAFKHDDSIQKYFFTADSDRTQTPKLIDDNILKDEAGTYTIYTVVKKYSTTGLFNKMYAQGYQTRNGLILKDGSIYAGSKATVAYTMHPYSFEFNGLELARDSHKQTYIELNSRDHYLYYKIVFHSDGSLNERMLTNYGDQTNTGGQPFAFFIYEAMPRVSAQFHFVDDLAYRAQTKQTNANAALKQRGNSDEHPSLTQKEKDLGFVISSVPNHQIQGLSDLAKPVITDPARFGRSQSNDLKYTILSFDQDPYAPKVENGVQTGVFRPTLEQLTSTHVPGYVYWDNDIDKPKSGKFENTNDTTEDSGNHYLSFGYEMKDGKPIRRLDTKYYYVTFRKIPTQVVFDQYKTNDTTHQQTPVTTGTFDLYQKNGTQETLVKKNISLSNDFAKDKPQTSDALVAAMKTKDALHKEGYYEVQNKLYLQPGSYVLRQTTAPTGEQPLDDIAFEINWQTHEGDTTQLTREPQTLKVVEINLATAKHKEQTPKTPPQHDDTDADHNGSNHHDSTNGSNHQSTPKQKHMRTTPQTSDPHTAFNMMGALLGAFTLASGIAVARAHKKHMK